MNLTLEEFLNIFTVSDPSGGRKLKVTTTGGLDDAESVLTISDPAGGRFIKVELTGGGGGGGNTNITPITVTALQALQTGSTISTTTFYNVTNAVGSTRVLQVYAIANNTNIVAAIDLATGEIGTYDITGDVFVLTANVRYVANNLFIGVNNAGNTIDGASAGNTFYDNADGNTLVASGNNVFGFNCQSSSLDNSADNTFQRYSGSHILLNAEYYEFGFSSNTCEVEGGSQNKIGNYCSGIKLLNANNCIFNDFVFNFDIVVFGGTPSFNLCTVASGDYSTIDFTNATSLFGRTNRWSINKILGTDLIEVTFDANLATSQTGQYDTSTDTFYPYGGTYTPTLTPDGSICTAAALAADAIYSVSNGVMKLMIPIDCTFDFTSNGAIIDYTLPFGSIASSGGNVTFNLNPNSPSLPISGYEKNGQIVVTTKDTAFNNDLTIYATITIKLA